MKPTTVKTEVHHEDLRALLLWADWAMQDLPPEVLGMQPVEATNVRRAIGVLAKAQDDFDRP